MRTPPRGFTSVDHDRLVRLLAEAWGFTAVDLSYVPVGFGSHHWLATAADGARRFVTLNDLEDKAAPNVDVAFEQLCRAMTTAHAARDTGLSFVVAPIPTGDGSILLRLGPRYAVAVFPYQEGAMQPPLADSTAAERARVVELVARVHDATAAVRASASPMVDDLALADRDVLERALGRLDVPWTTGPYGEPTRELLAFRREQIRAVLRAYDDLAARVRARRGEWVLTHGEPKADNLLLTPNGLELIDWDTALVAPPARDLWMVDAGAGVEIGVYEELTGRTVPADEPTFYRLRWDLADLGAFVAWFTRPHEQNADTEIGWNAIVEYVRIDERWPELLRLSEA